MVRAFGLPTWQAVRLLDCARHARCACARCPAALAARTLPSPLRSSPARCRAAAERPLWM